MNGKILQHTVLAFRSVCQFMCDNVTWHVSRPHMESSQVDFSFAMRGSFTLAGSIEAWPDRLQLYCMIVSGLSHNQGKLVPVLLYAGCHRQWLLGAAAS